MKWFAISAGLLLLTACANQDRSPSRDTAPGLHVASVALASGMPETALQVTREILQRDPHNTAALFRQADALIEMGHPDAAGECYTRVLAIDPRSSKALLGLGRVNLAKGAAHDAAALSTP